MPAPRRAASTHRIATDNRSDGLDLLGFEGVRSRGRSRRAQSCQYRHHENAFGGWRPTSGRLVQEDRSPPDNDGMRFLLAVYALTMAGCAFDPPKTQAWEPLPLGTDADFRDVYFADSLQGWMVGGHYDIDGGLVARTIDGGRTWSFQSGLVERETGVSPFALSAVRFLGDRRGVTAGTGGKILVTDDGGDHWRVVRHGRSLADHLNDLDFIDDQNGWAVGLGGVLRTRDGGETWLSTLRSSDENRYLSGNAIHFHDAWHGVMVGSLGSVWRTSDGGEEWVPAVTPFAGEDRPQLFDLDFVDSSHGWAVGEEGTMIATQDGGATWLRQDCGVPNARSVPTLERIPHRNGKTIEVDTGGRTPSLCLSCVRFVSPELGCATGFFTHTGRSLVLRTQDGGTTWSIDAEVEGEELRALFLLSADRGWAVGDRVRLGRHLMLRRLPPAPVAPS